jgi:para-nitrobenzyl esterase
VNQCKLRRRNTPEAQALAKKMATDWVNFARTGNPSEPGLTWTPADPTRCQATVFDNRCRMVDDPKGELRRICGRRLRSVTNTSSYATSNS